MKTVQIADHSASPDLRAAKLHVAGVPVANIVAADLILTNAVADATEVAGAGQPAYAQAILLNAGLHAERLLTIPEPHPHRAVA